MHTSDMGVVSVFVGSILWELVFDGPLHGNATHRTDQLFTLIQTAYDQLESSSRLGHLTRSMFEQERDYPRLCAKAAESRHVLFALEIVCDQLNLGSSRDEHRLLAIRHLCSMYRVFTDSGMFLTATAYLDAVTHV